MQTAACIDIVQLNNGTLQDAFQIDPDGEWEFDPAATFEMEIKASREDDTPLLTLTSGGGTIIVVDLVQRILKFNVTPAALQAALPCGVYVYDLLMVDGTIITPLLQGLFKLKQGVTEV